MQPPTLHIFVRACVYELYHVYAMYTYAYTLEMCWSIRAHNKGKYISCFGGVILYKWRKKEKSKMELAMQVLKIRIDLKMYTNVTRTNKMNQLSQEWLASNSNLPWLVSATGLGDSQSLAHSISYLSLCVCSLFCILDALFTSIECWRLVRVRISRQIFFLICFNLNSNIFIVNRCDAERSCVHFNIYV